MPTRSSTAHPATGLAAGARLLASRFAAWRRAQRTRKILEQLGPDRRRDIGLPPVADDPAAGMPSHLSLGLPH